MATRVLHATTNAVSYVQSSLSTKVSASWQPVWMHWVDDILLQDRTDDKSVEDVMLLFNLWALFRLRFHPKKCTLYAKMLLWCGRLLWAEGWCSDPRNAEGLQTMKSSINGAERQYFLCELQWMRTAETQFLSVLQTIQNFLENLYEKEGKRTNPSVAGIQLVDVRWNKTLDNSLQDWQYALASQVDLSHRDSTLRLSIYTDSCDATWYGLATQIPREDVTNSREKQRHSPLPFLSGHFTATEIRWCILEKKAFLIMATTERLRWMLATSDGFDLHTGYHNPIFMFDPLSLFQDLFASAIRNVLRWTVWLSNFNYVCLHIRGEEKEWADILGRWIAPHVIWRFLYVPTLSSLWAEDFVWRSSVQIASVQQSRASSWPSGLPMSEFCWRTSTGATRIPDEASYQQLHLLIIAHTCAADHRSAAPTGKLLNKEYWWSTLSAEVNTFARACIHCVSTTGGSRIPRTFGPAVYGSKPNALLQFSLKILPLALAMTVNDTFLHCVTTSLTIAGFSYLQEQKPKMLPTPYWNDAQLSATLRDSSRTGLCTFTMRHCAFYPKLFVPITTWHSNIPPGVTALWNFLDERPLAVLVQYCLESNRATKTGPISILLSNQRWMILVHVTGITMHLSQRSGNYGLHHRFRHLSVPTLENLFQFWIYSYNAA